MQNEIIEMLKVEEEKFVETLRRGEGMVKRIAADLKSKGDGKLSNDMLAELYDSHGLPPEIVKQAAEKEGVEVDVPENFYALIANRHMAAPKPTEEEETQAEKMLEEVVEQLPATEPLYYADVYQREFDAKVLKVVGGVYVVLDSSCFYPEGGGQPADHGWLISGNDKYEVVDTQKIGKVIIHKLKTPAAFQEDTTVHGVLDWERRYNLMKAHTVTHLINGAARRVLGEHVWQSGTQKGLETSRLDISHYRRLSPEEIHKIETLANQAIAANMKIETTWLPRNQAEALYGFRLYQGGAVPGKDIRVVKTGDWDVEACAGTHLGSTSEVGLVKIVYTERVQDGVERLGYAVGLKALKAVQDQESLLWKVSETLNAPIDKLDKTAEKMLTELKDARSENKRLLKELAAKESEVGQAQAAEAAVEINGVTIVKRDFGDCVDTNRMIQTASEVLKRNPAAVTLYYGCDGKSCRLMVMAGEDAVQKGVHAGNIVKEAAPIMGGGGGGRPNFAQGGGTQCGKLVDAVQAAETVVKKQLVL
jgi:alanyl-tRNA synthetase